MSEQSKPKITRNESKHLSSLFAAWRGLKDSGWEEPRFFKWSKAQEPFELIELGSTGIHMAVHHGDPAKVCWVDFEWPSFPFLVRHAKKVKR